MSCLTTLSTIVGSQPGIRIYQVVQDAFSIDPFTDAGRNGDEAETNFPLFPAGIDTAEGSITPPASFVPGYEKIRS
ncbi:hypothetical protein [Chitinophaga varians]|uniref:hypothetical protein n=1 Tax=Chitinophaga varians TaxID=2202339 RepID=UPI00165FF53B|nr:hypothetical protein [Chitinophaga varians]MBC9912951.1 hypothetical protein [Chitinophaga varians]